MTRRSSARRVPLMQVPLLLEEAELLRVRHAHTRLTGSAEHPSLYRVAMLCRKLLLVGCRALEAMPDHELADFVWDDDVMRALHERVSRQRKHDQKRANAFEKAQVAG